MIDWNKLLAFELTRAYLPSYHSSKLSFGQKTFFARYRSTANHDHQVTKVISDHKLDAFVFRVDDLKCKKEVLLAMEG